MTVTAKPHCTKEVGNRRSYWGEMGPATMHGSRALERCRGNTGHLHKDQQHGHAKQNTPLQYYLERQMLTLTQCHSLRLLEKFT